MPSRFDFIPTALAGLTVIHRNRCDDDRGSFTRNFCCEEFMVIGLIKPIAQINSSITCCKGTVRGLHFQYPPHAETKIISCLRGEVFDVAVDLRADSPTFLCWHAEVLSAVNQNALCIPEGFAHGFQALEDDCELIYLHTECYTPKAEGALSAIDPRINITWSVPITELSERDRAHLFIGPDFTGVRT